MPYMQKLRKPTFLKPQNIYLKKAFSSSAYLLFLYSILHYNKLLLIYKLIKNLNFESLTETPLTFYHDSHKQLFEVINFKLNMQFWALERARIPKLFL